MLDKLVSLNKLSKLHTAVTENCKYGNSVVLGFQSRSQMESADLSARVGYNNLKSDCFAGPLARLLELGFSEPVGKGCARESKDHDICKETYSSINTRPSTMKIDIATIKSLE